MSPDNIRIKTNVSFVPCYPTGSFNAQLRLFLSDRPLEDDEPLELLSEALPPLDLQLVLQRHQMPEPEMVQARREFGLQMNGNLVCRSR